MQDKLWAGGAWEQETPQWPAMPKVTVPPPAHRKKRKRGRIRRRRLLRGAAVVLSVTLILTAAGVALNQLFNDYFPDPGYDGEYDYYYEDREELSGPPAIPAADPVQGVQLLLEGPGEEELDMTAIYARTAPSMVSITAGQKDSFYYSTGAGIVLTRDGYILTNAHIVAGADEVTVTFFDNTTLTAALAGYAEQEDLAVLKVEAQDLTPASFGDSDLLQVGETVAALGDPLGYRATMTDGIISALDRDVTVEGHSLSLVQTSAAINSGNSGGALLNRYGQVVGVTTVKIVSRDGSSEALGFAIPARRLKYVADRLISGQPVSRGMFGLTVDTRHRAEGGVAILSVEEGGDAAAQGILPGDVVLRADGTPINTSQDLSRVRTRYGAGDPVELVIDRNGERLTVTVRLMET